MITMNMREFRRWNDYSAITLSILFNTLILFLACTERNMTLRSYSRMIILSCILDYVFCFGAFVTVISAVIKDGAFIAISDGMLRFLPIDYHYLFTGLHIFVVGCATCVVPIDYLYRYQLICRKRESSTYQLIIMVIFCCFVCLISTIIFVWAFGKETPVEMEKFAHILREEGIWTEADGSLVKFIGTDVSNPRLLLAIFTSGNVATLSYIISIYLGYKIYVELNSMRNVISQRTMRLQKSLTVVLIVKGSVPFVLATLPVFLLIVTVGLHINIPNFGLWLVIINSWIPVISPISTLVLLSGYRRRIFQSLRSSSVVNHISSAKLAYQNSMLNSRTL